MLDVEDRAALGALAVQVALAAGVLLAGGLALGVAVRLFCWAAGVCG